MAKTIGALCTLIVALQVLVGVPLAVCAAFFCFATGNLGPFTVEVHNGQGHVPQFIVHGATIPPPPGTLAIAPPPNAIPASAVASSLDNPILRSREEHGSPLAGTVLESHDPAEEQQTFITAFEKAAAEQSSQQQHTFCTVGETGPAACESASSNARNEAAHAIVRHLYEMAEIDEQTGDYARADQWRAFARGIKEEPSSEKEAHATAASFFEAATGDRTASGE